MSKRLDLKTTNESINSWQDYYEICFKKCDDDAEEALEMMFGQGVISENSEDLEDAIETIEKYISNSNKLNDLFKIFFQMKKQGSISVLKTLKFGIDSNENTTLKDMSLGKINQFLVNKVVTEDKLYLTLFTNCQDHKNNLTNFINSCNTAISNTSVKVDNTHIELVINNILNNPEISKHLNLTKSVENIKKQLLGAFNELNPHTGSKKLFDEIMKMKFSPKHINPQILPTLVSILSDNNSLNSKLKSKLEQVISTYILDFGTEFYDQLKEQILYKGININKSINYVQDIMHTLNMQTKQPLFASLSNSCDNLNSLLPEVKSLISNVYTDIDNIKARQNLYNKLKEEFSYLVDNCQIVKNLLTIFTSKPIPIYIFSPEIKTYTKEYAYYAPETLDAKNPKGHIYLKLQNSTNETFSSKLSHELTHYIISLIYENYGKPYTYMQNNNKEKICFQKITKQFIDKLKNKDNDEIYYDDRILKYPQHKHDNELLAYTMGAYVNQKTNKDYIKQQNLYLKVSVQ